MIKNIKFTKFKSKYQRELCRDLTELLRENMVIIKYDKTLNLYYATPQIYNKLMINNLISEYSISRNNPTSKIKNETLLMLSSNNISNRKITKPQTKFAQ